MTQDCGLSDASGASGGAKERINAEYPDLLSKTFRQKDLLGKKIAIHARRGNDPYTMMAKMHDDIHAMAEDTEKTEAISMYNAIYAQYESARKNELLRNYLSEVFGGLKIYADTKHELGEINTELQNITELYNEQEKEQVLAALEKKSKDRMAALEMKASEKAKKNDAKAPPPKKSKQ